MGEVWSERAWGRHEVVLHLLTPVIPKAGGERRDMLLRSVGRREEGRDGEGGVTDGDV